MLGGHNDALQWSQALVIEGALSLGKAGSLRSSPLRNKAKIRWDACWLGTALRVCIGMASWIDAKQRELPGLEPGAKASGLQLLGRGWKLLEEDRAMARALLSNPFLPTAQVSKSPAVSGPPSKPRFHGQDCAEWEELDRTR
jgi:hypothetical protein